MVRNVKQKEERDFIFTLEEKSISYKECFYPPVPVPPDAPPAEEEDAAPAVEADPEEEEDCTHGTSLAPIGQVITRPFGQTAVPARHAAYCTIT